MSNLVAPVTLLEAARILGVSSQTVRRLIQKKTLQAAQSVGPHGIRWEIERADLLRYLEGHGQVNNTQQPLHVDIGQHHNIEVNNPTTNRNTFDVDHGQHVDEGQQQRHQPQQGDSVPLVAHLAALDLARSQLEHLQKQAEDAQRMVLQAERAKISLEAQLGQYQRVLAEQAESLNEERARRMVLEAQVPAVSSQAAQLELPDVAPKVNTPQSRRGWGQRLKGWLLGEKTG